MSARVLSWNSAWVRGSVLMAMCLVFGATIAEAQPRRGGGASPEVLAKIQTAQATAVAASLKLDAEKTAKLVSVFTAFQKAQAAEERPERGGRGDWAAMRAQQEARVNALTTELKTFLDEAAAKEAGSILGGNNRGWDRLVGVIVGFGLEGPKEGEAMGYTLDYVKSTAAAQAGQSGERDFEAMRSAAMAAKKTLDAQVTPLLSDAQKATWSEETERGGRGGPRGGNADRDGRRGDDGGDRGGRRPREAGQE